MTAILPFNSPGVTSPLVLDTLKLRIDQLRTQFILHDIHKVRPDPRLRRGIRG